MKKTVFKKIIALAAIAIPLAWLATPHFAYACGLTSVFDLNCTVFPVTAWLAEMAFAAAGAILTLCGVLLNGTMVATLNIKQIVDATTAIGVAWRTIRDFSSIFIIFLLLYASIKMILGLKDANLGSLIKSIIVAGVLINFSLFFTKLAVDTSNIISLSFYNAIAPGQGSTGVAATNSFNGMISSAFNDGGISNVFMQSLSITNIVGSKSAVGAPNSGGDPNVNRTITLAYAGGVVLMLGAAFSFLFAAGAFAVRIGILILLMAFSPIYFIAMIFPQAKQYADRWRDTLIAMCLFMPVYLFLMYVAVSIINDPNFFNFARMSTTTAVSNNALVSPSTIGIVLQYIIAMIFINAPMAAAIEIGSKGTDIAVKFGEDMKKWGQGFVGRNTAGRFGMRAEKFLDKNAPTLSKTFIGESIRKNTTGSWANSTWGSSESRAKVVSEDKRRADARGQMARTDALRAAVQTAIASKDPIAIHNALGKMSDAEKIAILGKKTLTNPLVLEHLSESTFKKIEGSTTLSDSDKLDIAKARATTLSNAVSAGAPGIIANMLKNADGDTLADLDDTTLTNPNFIAHLRPSQLVKMDHLAQPIRKAIGDAIRLIPTHPAGTYIANNASMWS